MNISSRCQLRAPLPVLVYMRICTVGLVCGALLALPAGAGAAVCAPPGNSGVGQYLEVVPGASCNHKTGGPSGTHGGSLPPGTAHQLSSQGGAGQAVAALVRSTGTAPRGSAHRSGTHTAAVPSAPGRSLLPALLHPIVSGSGGGLGVLLPLLLAAALIAVGAAALLRRRRVHPEA